MRKLIYPVIFLFLWFTQITAQAENSNYSAQINTSFSELAAYEPETGCYIGAYILGNNAINYDIATFERLTEKAHSTYVYNMRLNEALPDTWILTCIAKGKTPYIVINPPEGFFFSATMAKQLADEISKYYVPIFIDFYPNAQKLDASADDYKNIFKTAREIFELHAPNAAFVWSVNITDVYDSSLYYPGNKYTDWVGLNIYKYLYENGEKYSFDIYKALDFFYLQHQQNKPIAISSLAISHYSTFNHAYEPDIAAGDITAFYDMLKARPRIKAVNYFDFNNVAASSSKKQLRDNFSITDGDNGEVLDAYKEAIMDSYFLSDISEISYKGVSTQKILSAYSVYNDGAEFFVSKNMLIYELGFDAGDLLVLEEEALIEGGTHYPIRAVEKNFGVRFDFDEIKKSVDIDLMFSP